MTPATPKTKPAASFKILHEFPTPDLEKAWRDYLSRLEFASHYESPEYFLEPLWPGKPRFAVLALEGDKVVGALTGLHSGKNATVGLPSRPQINVDPAANTAAAMEALAQGLLAETESAELVSVYTWSFLELPAFAAHGFQRQQAEKNVVLDLTKGADALFREFPKDRRRNIRFAEKNGVVISEIMTPQDVADGFAVQSAWRKTDRKVVHARKRSLEDYEKIVNVKGNRLLLLARVDGKAIAVNSFRYYPGGLFESSANSSLDEFIHLKPNDLLQWKGIEWACAHGLRRHSLGGSHPFLLRFGGTLIPVLRYRLDRTFLHRHDLRDTVQGVGRKIARKLPPFMEDGIRKLAGKKKKQK